MASAAQAGDIMMAEEYKQIAERTYSAEAYRNAHLILCQLKNLEEQKLITPDQRKELKERALSGDMEGAGGMLRILVLGE